METERGGAGSTQVAECKGLLAARWSIKLKVKRLELEKGAADFWEGAPSSLSSWSSNAIMFELKAFTVFFTFFNISFCN
ncbi:hypothetical protein FRX31_007281 [Thalictrum thalictroides]|uniref:Uncharacterized protein n=1 Tax=Thalictrum thalictroides TaxID=46969 RepID=A0A7J6X435_THATH|nr:hypothetical protein FRX31_007281 [Thalictrum thalictroides]